LLLVLLLSLLLQPPPLSTLFPYTTLFRSTLALRSPHLPCTESLCLLLLRGGHLHPEKAAPFACGLLASSRASGALLRRPASTRESEPPRSLSAWRWCDAT